MIRINTPAEWEHQIAHFDAVKADYATQTGPNDRAIWFETEDFGWIYSAKDLRGRRKILARY